MNTASDCLLTLIAPHDMAERIEDFLLSHAALSHGFTSIDAHGHGNDSHYEQQPIKTQVLGHTPRKHIEITAPLSTLQHLLHSLKATMPELNMYYWITPVIERGYL